MANKNILITGARGQLGSEISPLIPGAILTDSESLDITKFQDVKDFIKRYDIDTVINCAAYTATDRAEDEEKEAYMVNMLGPRNLAENAKNIIHISTDYVFDGNAHKPYKTNDETNPVSVYGRSKLAGERAVLDKAQNAIIIRTAWLYSPFGNNFVKTMRRLGAEKTEINVVDDQIGSPTYAADLAHAIVAIIPQMSYQNRGIYHFTNMGVCSWYDFATEIMKRSHLQCRVNPIPSTAYPTKIARPYYSVLDKSKIKDTFGVQIPHWTDGLARCLGRMH